MTTLKNLVAAVSLLGLFAFSSSALAAGRLPTKALENRITKELIHSPKYNPSTSPVVNVGDVKVLRGDLSSFKASIFLGPGGGTAELKGEANNHTGKIVKAETTSIQ
jgi:hypothetical protein